MPARLSSLGLSGEALGRHIGWDIGIAALGARLSERLDATFVEQRYSRLVIDCNRWPDAPDVIAEASDGTPVPGNAGLDAAARAERFAAIYDPYHAAVAGMLEERDAAGRASILVALHSFTPVLAGAARPWDVGVLHDGGDARFALRLLTVLVDRAGWVVGDNEPYRMDATDHSVPRHAYPALRPYAEIEVNQRLLADAAGVERVAVLLADVLVDASRPS